MFDSISSFKGPGFQYCRAFFLDLKFRTNVCLTGLGSQFRCRTTRTPGFSWHSPADLQRSLWLKESGSSWMMLLPTHTSKIFPQTLTMRMFFSPGKLIFLDCLFLETKPKYFFHMLLCFSVFFCVWPDPDPSDPVLSSEDELSLGKKDRYYVISVVFPLRSLITFLPLFLQSSHRCVQRVDRLVGYRLGRGEREESPETRAQALFSLSSKVSSELFEVVSGMFLLIAIICHRHFMNSNLFCFLWGIRFPFSPFRSHTVQKLESQPLRRSPAHESIKIWTWIPYFSPIRDQNLSQTRILCDIVFFFKKTHLLSSFFGRQRLDPGPGARGRESGKRAPAKYKTSTRGSSPPELRWRCLLSSLSAQLVTWSSSCNAMGSK